VNLPIYLPPVGEPADLPAEGMEAWRNEGRRHETTPGWGVGRRAGWKRSERVDQVVQVLTRKR